MELISQSYIVAIVDLIASLCDGLLFDICFMKFEKFCQNFLIIGVDSTMILGI